MEKIVLLDGYKFVRDEKTGYYLSSCNIDGKRRRLHRYVWEKYNGVIPKGFQVHHKDLDKSNNGIENLELLEIKSHLKVHSEILKGNEIRLEKMRKNLDEKARPKASEWHRSDEGREWHKKQWETSIGALEERVYTCKHCEIIFSKKPFGANKFCSNACKSAWRRKAGLDDEQRKCVICNELFTINKYSKTKTCSLKCKGVFTWSK